MICESGRVDFRAPKVTFRAFASADVFADALQIVVEGGFVLAVNDVKQCAEFFAYLFDLSARAGIEKDFAQETIILTQDAARNFHVTFEGCARRILMLHHCGEHKGADEGNAERISHRAVVLVESVFADVQVKATVEVTEEDAPHVVSFADDDGVFVAQCPEVGEGGAEHRVCGDVTPSALFVELFESGFDGGDVAEDAVFGKVRHDFAEDVERVFQRNGVDDELGFEIVNFLQGGETLGVIHEPKSFRVNVIDSRLVVKTQEVHEERAHFSGSENEDAHGFEALQDF